MKLHKIEKFSLEGAALILLVVGINLFADWLREELNPKIERKN